ncbi:citrate lyase subunit gamma (acyl carrier protein) [Clostridium tetanomorphum]|uniref:Citrate lyase acyl carrier protein n=1 Tax=Clostridium tetanomorphum TaxID=1553 RepID=A0A923EBX6_CLOTT|nr:citrate lyase acyl carrier protein [Clostridium tetanomorphum]KAJ52269.1 citrate lyase subunit gamma [Clostridium tetanomorphum DSM 665]MBC2397580.1 citrate lyase acyl carrier protein [Clostridium tetanomorphum]MBP1863726.1 citrate lyase subunit gamma (acyl carrier protein) [Clostridium tetanomorphum]NRS86302.1 citrate lyase subunit gamma (acyl carrier protein) [Clostridium tetanomorphum]NRZ95668.1 citrate lyase subunit gamma (acyl carrier protein) [Clostridium tetanomorphum]
MKINKVAKAGTLESNDILIMVMPNDKPGVEIELESIVMKQFGEQIKKVLVEKAKELELDGVKIQAQDKGALDYTIKARLETAVNRAQ